MKNIVAGNTPPTPPRTTEQPGALKRTNRRNRYGVKAACDCYRTIRGEEYKAWMSCPSADRISAYRAANVRCRRFGEELFVHVWDTEDAAKVDQSLDDPRAASPTTAPGSTVRPASERGTTG